MQHRGEFSEFTQTLVREFRSAAAALDYARGKAAALRELRDSTDYMRRRYERAVDELENGVPAKQSIVLAIVVRIVLALSIFAAAAMLITPAAPCSTDTECMQRHGGDGSPS